MPKILLVEDDKGISEPLMRLLAGEGFTVTLSEGQSAAEYALAQSVFDLVLLDVALPDGSGFPVCAAAQQRQIPVIFLTASGAESSVVAGLDMGADDYITKPFRPRELISRMRNVLRRRGGSSVLQFGNVTVDTDKATVTKNGAPVPLTSLEYRILLVFLSNRGKVLTRDRLLEEIWDIAGDYVNDNTLTVYMKRLREKLEDDPQNPQWILTLRGLGYRLDG